MLQNQSRRQIHPKERLVGARATGEELPFPDPPTRQARKVRRYLGLSIQAPPLTPRKLQRYLINTASNEVTIVEWKHTW